MICTFFKSSIPVQRATADYLQFILQGKIFSRFLPYLHVKTLLLSTCLSYLLHSCSTLLYCLGLDSPEFEPCCCAWLWGSAVASCSDGCTRKRCFSPTGQIGRGSAGPRPQRRPCSPCQIAPPSTAGQRRSWCQLGSRDTYVQLMNVELHHFVFKIHVDIWRENWTSKVIWS